MEGRGGRAGGDPERRAMPDDPRPGRDHGRLRTYLIRVEGHLDDRFDAWPDRTTVTLEDGGDTVLTVPLVDQAALLGVLRRLRDLGVRLVSVNAAGTAAETESREGYR